MEHIYIAAAFLSIVIVLAAFIRLNVKDLETLLQAAQHKPTFRSMAKKKGSRLQRLIHNTMAMMTETGQAEKIYFLLAASLFLMVLGAAAGIGLGNYFLSPILAVALASIPFLFIQFQYLQYKKLVIEELEVTLSTISLSYERTENILSAIEENLENIQPPIRQVFTEFVNTVRYLNPHMESAIDTMKNRIDHSVWKEWCDALRCCAQSRTLKYTLRPIVQKLTKIKRVSGELQNILYKAQRTFWQLILLTGGLLVLCLYVLPTQMHISIPQHISHIVIAFNVLIILFTVIKVLMESRDVQFDI